MKVTRDGRSFRIDVVSDGEGLVSHAGSALLARVADKVGLTGALSLELAGLKQRRSGHDQGHVIRDLAVMLADGGDCLADLGTLGDQESRLGVSLRPRPRSGSSIGSPGTRMAWGGCAGLTQRRGHGCGS